MRQAVRTSALVHWTLSRKIGTVKEAWMNCWMDGLISRGRPPSSGARASEVASAKVGMLTLLTRSQLDSISTPPAADSEDCHSVAKGARHVVECVAEGTR